MDLLAPKQARWMTWTGRIFSALPCIMLTGSASMKLSMSADVIKGFTTYGYPENVIIPLGIVELVCAIIYLVPQTAVLGAILLTGYLGGAVATHVRAGEAFLPPLILGVIVWIGIFLRDPRLRALMPLAHPRIG